MYHFHFWAGDAFVAIDAWVATPRFLSGMRERTVRPVVTESLATRQHLKKHRPLTGVKARSVQYLETVHAKFDGLVDAALGVHLFGDALLRSYTLHRTRSVNAGASVALASIAARQDGCLVDGLLHLLKARETDG